MQPAGRGCRGRRAGRPDGACTSTSPCRSRGTSSRTPAGCRSRSAATRSRRRGAGSGRRRAGTASSPRPTSTSWTSVRCRSALRGRDPARRGGRVSAAPDRPVPHPGQQPQARRGVLPRHRPDRRRRTLRIVDKLDKIGPDKVAPMLEEPARRRAGPGLPGAGPIRSDDLERRGRGPRAGVTHPSSSTRAWTHWRRSSRRRWSRRPAWWSRTSASRAVWTTTPGRCTRPRWWATSRGARSAPADATTRSPRDGQPRIRRRDLDRRVPDHRPAARAGPRAGRPVVPTGGAGGGYQRMTPGAAEEVDGALRARGIASEVAGEGAKFGKHTLFAERREIPYAWFPRMTTATRSGRSAPETRSRPTRRRGKCPSGPRSDGWTASGDRTERPACGIPRGTTTCPSSCTKIRRNGATRRTWLEQMLAEPASRFDPDVAGPTTGSTARNRHWGSGLEAGEGRSCRPKR